MGTSKAAKNADSSMPHEPPPTDRGESPALMEPMRIAAASPHRQQLTDLALDLAARAAGFRRALPQGMQRALADLVRSMNCYYSNLIEGHDTHPIAIERALNADFSADPNQRNLLGSTYRRCVLAGALNHGLWRLTQMPQIIVSLLTQETLGRWPTALFGKP